MLADENVHGAVLQPRDAPRFPKDVNTKDCAPGRFKVATRLVLDDACIGPVLKVAEDFWVVLGHFDCLGLGFLKVATECRSKETGGIAD